MMTNLALQRAHAAYSARRYDLVVQIVMAALIDEPNHPVLLLTLACAKLQTKAFDECRHFARCAIEVEPEYASAYEILAWGILQDSTYVSTEIRHGEPDHRGRIREARRCVSTALAIDSQSSRLFRLKVEIERLSNNLPAALKQAELGLALDPNNTACGNLRMQIFLEMGRATDAIRIGMGLLEINPEDDRTHSLLAQCYLKAGQSSSALAHARQAVRLSPEDADFRRTYWDAVAAQWVLFRWLVRWQLFQRTMRQKYPELFVTSFIGLFVGTIGLVQRAVTFLRQSDFTPRSRESPSTRWSTTAFVGVAGRPATLGRFSVAQSGRRAGRGSRFVRGAR